MFDLQSTCTELKHTMMLVLALVSLTLGGREKAVSCLHDCSSKFLQKASQGTLLKYLRMVLPETRAAYL